MPKKIHNALTPLQVKNAKPGRHVDGSGLHLLVKNSGAKSWVLRYRFEGKPHDVGISQCPEAIELLQATGQTELTLAQVRDIAAIYRMQVRAGINPLEKRKTKAPTIKVSQAETTTLATSFKDAAIQYLRSREATWRNAKHRQQWRNTLTQYVYPHIGEMELSSITTKEVLEVLEPIWHTKSETANRVRGRIEAVIDYAKARGDFTGENPARWRGHLEKLLPARSRLSRGHHKAMPYLEVPEFLTQLRERHAMAALALEFTVLTAGRTSEVLGATWDEIDFQQQIWTIPATRMKAGREHRVPLSPRAMEIINHTRQLNGTYLFPGPRGGKLSGMAMSMLLRRMEKDATVHGFRSSFRDWAGETTAHAHEVCEMALAHSVSDRTVAAYRRGDLFEKRLQLMVDWEQFCVGIVSNEVV